MSEDDNGGWRLLVSFPDQSPSFARGVEAGKVWMRLKAETGMMQFCTMTPNREVLRRMAEYWGWRFEAEPDEIEGWDRATFTKVRPAGQIVNPHGLRVVQE